jgi:hypothetical protein
MKYSCNHAIQHQIVYSVGYNIGPGQKAVVLIDRPDKEIYLGTSSLNKKLKHILFDNHTFGSLHICFLNPYLKESTANPTNETLIKNLKNFEHLMENAHVLVAAWGSIGSCKADFIPFLYLAQKHHADIKCLGITKENEPKSPTYLKLNQTLLPYEGIK